LLRPRLDPVLRFLLSRSDIGNRPRGVIPARF